MKQILSRIKRSLLYAYQLLRDTFKEYSQDKAFRHGAAIAYYTLFSLPAVLIIVIRLAGIAFGETEVRGEVLSLIEANLTQEAANQVANMMDNISRDTNTFWATMLSIGTLIFGASGVFYSIRDSLNAVWKLRSHIPKGNFIKLLFDRVLSFTMVLTLGFIMLVSMVLHTIILAFKTIIERFGVQLRDLLRNISTDVGAFADQIEIIFYVAFVLEELIGLLVVTLTFALIFKFLADAYPRWSDVMVGALFTAILFTIGKVLIGWYISESNVGTTYGAAGSVVLLLLWVYYSAQILLLGAEFVYVYTRKKGRKIKPSKIAIRLTDRPLKRLVVFWHKVNPFIFRDKPEEDMRTLTLPSDEEESDESTDKSSPEDNPSTSPTRPQQKTEQVKTVD